MFPSGSIGGGNTSTCSIDWGNTPTALGVLIRCFLTTNGPGREIGTITGGATSRVGHFVADDSLSADKLKPEEPSLPKEGGECFPGREFVGTSLEFSFFERFGWLEARFELETGRSSCAGREPAK